MWEGLLHKLQVHFWSFDAVVVLATWLSALIGAAIAYVVQAEESPKTLRGYLRYCFPSVILRNKSCRLDALFIALTHYISFPALVMVSNLVVAELSYAGLTALFGQHAQTVEPLWLWFALLCFCVVVQDFGTFVAHVWQHRVGFLWELHKVHHSAEFLIPISNRRFHPLQAIMDNAFTMIPVGLILGVTSYVFSLPVHDNSVIGLDALFVLNMLSFYHLRHSHIPLRYGWFERHMISPAQHQLHHSREERHWDKNFGLCFSWWDRWLGSIVYATPQDSFVRGDFALGLPLDIQGEYRGPVRLLWVPVRNIALMAARGALRLLPAPAAMTRDTTPGMRDAA